MIRLVPEVGIPSINELVLSEVEGGQAHRHGVKPFSKILNVLGLQIIGAGGLAHN